MKNSNRFRFASPTLLRFALAILVTITISLRDVARGQSSTPPTPDEPLAITSFGLTPRPMPPWFNFLPKSVIDSWVVNHNIKAITEHAWALWGAISSPTNEQFRGVRAPVYLTWWPQQDVFAAQAPVSQLVVSAHGIRFERPRQLDRTRPAGGRPLPEMPLPGSQTVSVTVQYNNPIFLQVRKNQYYLTAVLESINNAWGATPIAAQSIEPFPANSVMTKPTCLFAFANAPTQLQYWTGPAEQQRSFSTRFRHLDGLDVGIAAGNEYQPIQADP